MFKMPNDIKSSLGRRLTDDDGMLGRRGMLTE